MPKLHQLLAVHDNVKGQATKTLNDLKGTLHGKRHLFEEVHKEFQPTVDGLTTEVIEQKDIQTTVLAEIKWVTKHLSKAVDVGYQVDIGNLTAKADIKLEDGTIIAKDVPATSLLQLEKRVSEWHDLIAAIPTLDPAKGFALDTARGEGIYKAREVRKDKTRKEDKVITLAPPTDKHPAQVALKTIDAPVGHIIEQEWSSLITPAKKAELLEQAETLRNAIKDARSRANEQLVDDGLKIGNTLLEFVFKPLLG